ncbi:MAG: tryptophan synthase subunit beta [Vulcanimicrobiota bacterium]
MLSRVPAGPAPLPDPDIRGRFGDFGGRFVPETLVQALRQLAEAYTRLRQDPGFWQELSELMNSYSGRPTPLYRARRLQQAVDGPELWLKREDLNHTGSHKINNCLGQALLARRLGKTTILAETGAGQHGVATATVCALLDMKCRVYMGAEDVRRQALNVSRMRLLGAEVIPVESGSRTLKDATNEALRAWVGQVDEAHYILGSVVGPHPYPWMVRDFQAVIGHEIAEQLWPRRVIACVGGGSNAAGAFARFVPHAEVKLVGVEAGGHGFETGQHCASLGRGKPGVLHGALTYLLQDEFGQVSDTHSISAGLDYPGVGPEHSCWAASGRVEYHSVSDQEALEAFELLCRCEGIVPALESAHALAWYAREGPKLKQDGPWVLCLSGRGDKDVQEVLRLRGLA